VKLPTLTGSSTLGSGPAEGLGKKDEGIAARPMHLLERKIAPHIMPNLGHGAHIKSLASTGAKPDSMGAMSPIPSGGLTGQ
jgi:hypothetical protein